MMNIVIVAFVATVDGVDNEETKTVSHERQIGGTGPLYEAFSFTASSKCLFANHHHLPTLEL
jgi:hypothetical protein